jgi:hypothetical protein
MKSRSSWSKTGLVLAVGAFCAAFTLSASAQVQTQTTTTHGTPSKEVRVEHGEVMAVEGNDLFVKMEDGSIRHFPNISETARIDVDGQQLGIHDLKPGMKLQRTITTTTTPKTVTTVQTVTGTVWHVSPPTTVILTLENGQNQQFKIPKGQQFNVNGQMVDAFHLKKGMKVSATKITEVPETVIAEQRKVTGTMPPPPPAPPADVPILIVTEVSAPTPAEAPAAAPAKQLPKTASELPLVGLLGILCVSLALGIKLIRASVGQ